MRMRGAAGMTGDMSTRPSPRARRAAYAAAVLALLNAAVSFYWALGGHALLRTVGGWVENLARRGGAAAVGIGLLAGGLKLAGSMLALALAPPVRRRLPNRLLWAVAAAPSGLLVLYGGGLVCTGVLGLDGAITPAGTVDRTALRWHVFVWDSWFLLWGLLLGLAVF